jgi:alkanesulfonate monooxygenase SsuD/methylene tetrahydromethanopterin reductase-like flavin-dependent oxidoreductase (luciferase family)
VAGHGKHFGLAQVPQRWMMFPGNSAAEHAGMEFGILFTSHSNTDTEPYPHRGVHARVTSEILRADELGYDTAWLAEHHFSNEYGIMPDVFVYAGYLAGLTRRIRIGGRSSNPQTIGRS